MKSIKSMFYVGKDTFKRFLPFSIAYWVILLCVYPLLQIMDLIAQSHNSYYNFDNMETYTEPRANSFMQIPVSAVAIVFSTVIAIMAFYYLHNKRSMDFFGSMPVSRRIQFFGRMITVILCTIVPVIVVTFIGSAIYGFVGTLGSYAVMGKLIIGVIGNITFIGFISVCSGTVAHTIVSYLIINGIYPIFITICCVFPTSVLPGFTEMEGFSFVGATLLCPLLAPFTPYSNMSSITDSSTNNLLYIIWWLCLSAVLVGLSCILIKKRKSECAQNSFAFVFPNIVIRLFATITAGWIAGFLFASVFSTAFTEKFPLLLLFCLGFFVGSGVTHLVLHLIYHKGFSEFGKWLILYGIEFALGLSFCVVVITGMFGFVTRVPSAEDVEKISVDFNESWSQKYIVDGKDVNVCEVTSKEDIQGVIDFHQKVIDSIEAKYDGIYVNNENNIYEAEYEEIQYANYIAIDNEQTNVSLTYTLKNGTTIVRDYKYSDLMECRVKNPDLIMDLYKVCGFKQIGKAPLDDVENINLSINGSKNKDIEEGSYSIYGKAGKEIVRNVIKDYEQYGIIGRLAENDEIFCIMISYTNDDDDYLTETIIFDGRYKNTLKYLKSIDVSQYEEKLYD